MEDFLEEAKEHAAEGGESIWGQPEWSGREENEIT